MRQTVETVRSREVDPDTGKPTWVFKEVVKTHLTDEDRLSLVTDIICGRTTAEEVQKKYCIVSINSVYTWVGKYLSQTKELSLQEQT